MNIDDFIDDHIDDVFEGSGLVKLPALSPETGWPSQ